MQSTIIFECLVERQHFFRNKTYFLQLTPSRITLSEVQIIIKNEKKKNQLNPKYVFILKMDKIFNWSIQKNQIVGFTLIYQEKIKEFFGNPQQMLELKEKMGIYVCYERIERFYKQEEIIENGSFGEVTREVCRFTQKVVAIKSIKIQNNQTPTIMNEIEILKRLQLCEQILQIKEVYKDDQRYHIVTEYIQGKSLKQLLENKQKPLPLSESLIIIKEILKGLKFIHTAEILHRDLKPANIMYHNGCVKIIDFGLACFNGKQLEQFPTCGTTGYSAPEVINVWNKKQPYDYKADLFSIGCILYKLLTLESVFQSDNQKETFQQNKQCIIHIKEKGAIFDLIKLLLKAEPQERLNCNQALEAVQSLQEYKHFDVTLWYNSKCKNFGRSIQDFDYEEKTLTRQLSINFGEKTKTKKF